MKSLSNNELVRSATRALSIKQRLFPINAKGHPVGEGVEIINKTSKLTGEGRMIVLHTLKDGRRVRYTVEVFKENGEKHAS